jgi:hypothetical protein
MKLIGGHALRIRHTLRQSILTQFVTIHLPTDSEHMEAELDAKRERALLPRFSIRTLFWMITASSVIFVVVGMAARGHDWAWGVSIGLASILFTAVVHAAVFCAVSLFGQLASVRPKDVK